jgi:hypothetical protein
MVKCCIRAAKFVWGGLRTIGLVVHREAIRRTGTIGTLTPTHTQMKRDSEKKHPSYTRVVLKRIKARCFSELDVLTDLTRAGFVCEADYSEIAQLIAQQFGLLDKMTVLSDADINSLLPGGVSSFCAEHLVIRLTDSAKRWHAAHMRISAVKKNAAMGTRAIHRAIAASAARAASRTRSAYTKTTRFNLVNYTSMWQMTVPSL